MDRRAARTRRTVGSDPTDLPDGPKKTGRRASLIIGAVALLRTCAAPVVLVLRPLAAFNLALFIFGSLYFCPRDWTTLNTLPPAALSVLAVLGAVGGGLRFSGLLIAVADWVLLGVSFVKVGFCAVTGVELDPRTAIYNLNILLYGPSLRLLLSKAWPAFWVLVCGFTLGVALDRLLGPLHERAVRAVGATPRLWPGIVAAAVAWLLLVGFVVAAQDDRLLDDLTAAADALGPPAAAHLAQLGIDPRTAFPLLVPGPLPATWRHRIPSSAAPAASPHHVFIVRLESFSGVYFGRNCSACGSPGSPDVPLTPTLVEFARGAGTAWTNSYYANSVQTARTTPAMLCGLSPSWRVKECQRSPLPSLRCLPHAMRELGYRSTMFVPFDDTSFDNVDRCATGVWGFDEVSAATDELAVESGASVSQRRFWGCKCWGWTGREFYRMSSPPRPTPADPDDVNYGAFFALLDKRMKEYPGIPTFSVIETATSHMPFHQAAANSPYTFTNPRPCRVSLTILTPLQ